jgi:hypothetical protein
MERPRDATDIGGAVPVRGAGFMHATFVVARCTAPMAKVSVGLRGWRFEESEVFTDDGEFKPLLEMPEDARKRLVRLTYLVEDPCDACYLVHGEAEKRRCNPATIVYGEPGDEVLLCEDHEADFLYWFREAGGSDHRGEERFRDEFHEWFAGDGRAPEGYGGLDHVATDPESLPSPPSATELDRRLNENYDNEVIDIRELAGVDDDEERLGPDDLDDLGLDLDTEYPT